jgi:hypothetical protein
VRTALVLWIVTSDPELDVLAVDPQELGIGIPDDVFAYACGMWKRSARVLVTTRRTGLLNGRCDALLGHVTAEEAIAVEAALAALVS